MSIAKLIVQLTTNAVVEAIPRLASKVDVEDIVVSSAKETLLRFIPFVAFCFPFYHRTSFCNQSPKLNELNLIFATFYLLLVCFVSLF